jgi:hypothetical protein
VLEKYIKEAFSLFCKPEGGGAESSEVFSVVNHFLGENEINWENCIGLSIDSAQLMSGQNAGVHVLIRKKAHHIIQAHYMVCRQALASRNMSEALQTVFQAVIS